MPLPSSPIEWEGSMDSADVVDFEMTLAGTTPLLDTANGEEIASYTLTVMAEGVALGLQIGSGAYAPAPIEGNTGVRLWLSVDSGSQSDSAFSGSGTALGVVGKFVTNSSPARTYERTWAVTVKQR